MAEIKKISTEFQLLDKFLDTSGDAGTSGQILSSTATGINWVSGSSLPGGPYLPLAGGTMTGALTINLSSEGTYFTGGSGAIRQLSITSGTNISANALHTFNIASSNGKYEFDVNGTTEFSLDSSSAVFTGNVGIGTTIPQVQLHVAKNSPYPNASAVTSSNTGFVVSGNDGLMDLLSFDDNTTVARKHTSLGMGRYSQTTGSIIDKWGLVTWYDTGNQGSNLSDRLAINYGTSNVPWSNSEKVSITREGNVGIGVTGPSKKLHVVGDQLIFGDLLLEGSANSFRTVSMNTVDGSDNQSLYLCGGATASTARGGYVKVEGNEVSSAGGTVKIAAGNVSTGDIDFLTANTQRMIINNAGNVGIGVTAPTSSVHVNGLQTNSGSTSAHIPTGTMRLNFAGASSADEYGASLVFTQRWWTNSSGEVAMGQITGVKETGNGNYGGGLAFFTSNNTSNNLLERLRINELGNVGIGTTSPNTKLDVNGDVFINSDYPSNTAAQDLTIGKTTTGDHGLTIVTSNTNTAGIFFADNNNNDAGRIKYQHSNNSMRFDTNRSEAMRITSAGNVGIGTTSPSSLLSVGNAAIYDNPSTTVNIATTDTGSYLLKVTSDQFNADGNWVGIGLGYSNNYMKMGIIAEAKDNNARGKLHFAVNTTAGSSNASISDAKMTIDNGGNVGIGTASPAAPLHVLNDSSANVLAKIRIQGDSTSGYGDIGMQSGYIRLFSNGSMCSAWTGNVQYNYINGSNATTLNSTGFGIGTTSPQSKLHIESTGEALRFTRSGQETYRVIHGTSGLYFSAPNAGDLVFGITQNSDVDIFNTSGSVMFRADGSTSNVGIGTTSPNFKLGLSNSDCFNCGLSTIYKWNNSNNIK